MAAPSWHSPTRRAYRLRRFIGRHRLATAMTAALGAMVVSFAVVAGLQARAQWRGRARPRPPGGAPCRARVRARHRSLHAGRPRSAGRGNRIAARELLDAGRTASRWSSGNPETQVALFNASPASTATSGCTTPAIAVLERASAGARALATETERWPAGGDASPPRRAATPPRPTIRRAEGRFREALALRRRCTAPGEPTSRPRSRDSGGRSRATAATPRPAPARGGACESAAASPGRRTPT